MIGYEIDSGEGDTLSARYEEDCWQFYRRVDGVWVDCTLTEARERFISRLNGDYQRFTIHLEDTILVSIERGCLRAFDCMTGTYYSVALLSRDQVQAICELALSDDDHPDAEALYKVLEPVLANWPNECRPVP